MQVCHSYWILWCSLFMLYPIASRILWAVTFALQFFRVGRPLLWMAALPSSSRYLSFGMAEKTGKPFT